MSNSTNRVSDLNGGDDEDEALRIAIALSLGQDPGPRSGLKKSPEGQHDTIDLTHDDDDDDDATASGSDAENHVDTSAGIPKQPVAVPSNVPMPDLSIKMDKASNSLSSTDPSSTGAIQPIPPLSIMGLDRKKMEEERLARLNKRKASELESSPKSAAPRPSQRTKSESISLPQRRAKNPEPGPVAGHVSGPVIPYPQGVVKKTWASGKPRRGDDIKIEEVLQKDKLQLAVLSSFQWDEDWLLSQIDISRTKMILIAFAADDEAKTAMRSNVPGDRIRFCFPPMNGPGAMHSKLQLLKYEKYMRIVVPTGNLMAHDWGENGTMENMVFLIDLPKFETAEQRDGQELTAFAENLFYFLRAQGLDEKLINSLRNYDFSETHGYGFIYSIPGSHTAEKDWQRIGYCGLGRAVAALGMATDNALEFDYVCSSIGAVNMSLVASLYYACQGDFGLKEYSSRIGGRKGKETEDVAAAAALREHFRVYFPSLDTIMKSDVGTPGAGTICFQRKWWQAPSFPKWMLRDCKSTRKGLVMHSKAIFVRHHGESSKAFAYVGSANLSESAWGRLVKDQKTKMPKLTCRNWECGVLVVAGFSTTQGGAQQSKQVAMAVFDDRVPIPMEVPGTPFSAEADGREAPWFGTC